MNIISMKNYSKKQNSQEIVLISKVLISAFLFLLFISSQAFAGSTLNDFYNALDSRTKNPTQERIDSDVYITKEYAEKGKIWGNYLYYTDPNKYNPSELQRLLKSGGVEKIRQEVATKYNTDTDSIVNNCKSIRLYPYCNIADTVTNIVHSLQNTARESVGKYCSQSECKENCSNAIYSTEAEGYKYLGSCFIENHSKTDRTGYPYCSQSECNKYCSNTLFVGPNFRGCSIIEYPQTNTRATLYCTPDQCSENCSNAIFGSTDRRNRILMYCAQTRLSPCSSAKCSQKCSNVKFILKDNKPKMSCEQTEPSRLQRMNPGATLYCTPNQCSENCSNAVFRIPNNVYRILWYCEQNQSTTDRTRNNDKSKTDRTGYPFCNQSECKNNRISCRNFLYVGSVFKGCSSKEYSYKNQDRKGKPYCIPDQCSENCSNAVFGSTDDSDHILMYCKQTKLSPCSQDKCSQKCSNVKFIFKNNRQQMYCKQTNKAIHTNYGPYGGITNVSNSVNSGNIHVRNSDNLGL